MLNCSINILKSNDIPKLCQISHHTGPKIQALFIPLKNPLLILGMQCTLLNYLIIINIFIY